MWYRYAAKSLWILKELFLISLLAMILTTMIGGVLNHSRP